MNKKLCMALLCLIVAAVCHGQQFYFPKIDTSDNPTTAKQIARLASRVIAKYHSAGNKIVYLSNLFRLQMAAGKHAEAITAISTLRELSKNSGTPNPELLSVQYELFSRAKIDEEKKAETFDKAFATHFGHLMRGLDDKTAVYISSAFLTRNGIAELKDNYYAALRQALAKDSISLNEAVELCKAYNIYRVFERIEPAARGLLRADDNRRYIMDDSVMIKTKEGATLSAVVVRKRGVTAPQPAALLFFIYSNLDRCLYEAKYSAAYGYAGIVADTRGKRLSPDPIEPYEHESHDVADVIDWIADQPWSNGKVGMYGGSYSGYAQWAATKRMPRALKTIVPYVAAIPGQGLPMENNVFLTANYQWAFYVTDNKYVDDPINNDNARWSHLRNNWYKSGAAFNKIDSIDGTPNPWLQKWLKHPSFDKYWQDMVPYKTDFAKINIPVLTFEGYYDDGQISGLQYFTDHYKYNPKANHYLIIGPYDHFGTQHGGDAVLRDYQIDPVALINTRELTFQWLDYILKGGKKPAILKDRINYEVMGANVWKHAPSLAAMSNKTLKLYLTNIKTGSNYVLSAKKPLRAAYICQKADLANRDTANSDYYPFPIIKKHLDRTDALFFISKPFDKPVGISGQFKGELKAIINKRDMDVCLTFYEVNPKGEYFELTYFVGRASYARDMTKRTLLHPGLTETISFTRTRMTSKQFSKGSRLLVVLTINKNPFAQINYGTGKDVSTESIKDADEPLKIWWKNDSYINVPVME
ncbi:MAG: CocE/NonD family hydrolase [Mucilaginibacter sp.]